MKARLAMPILLLLVLEIGVTVATAYEHHSEARWEVSAAYFGTIVGYLLGRAVVWLPAALAAFLVAKLCHRQLPVGQLAAAAFVLEVTTTLGSVLLRAKEPPYGIFFGSFPWYLGARLLFWVPMALAVPRLLSRLSPRPRQPQVS